MYHVQEWMWVQLNEVKKILSVNVHVCMFCDYRFDIQTQKLEVANSLRLSHHQILQSIFS